MEDDNQSKDSGLLSPRRIEAIHIAFNKVFDNAREEGLIRDEKTYRTFNEVFEIAMKIKEGLPVEDVTVGQSFGKDKAEERGEEMVVEQEHHEGFAAGEEADVSMDMGGFSDEDNDGFGDMGMEVEEVVNGVERKEHPQRKRNPSKRKIEQIDEPPPPPSSPKKPRRIRHSEPIYNTHPLDNLDIVDPRPSPRRKTFTPQRIQHHLSSDSEPEPTPADLLPSSVPSPYKSTLDVLGIPPLTTVTLVLQRNIPPKPRDLYIPLWGRRRGRSKRISLDRLWEVHYRLERMKKAGIPLPQYKAPVYKIPSATKQNTHVKVEVQQPKPRSTSTVSTERGRERDKEYRPPSKIRRGTWGGDRRSAAFQGRYKRLGSGRDGSSPTTAGDSRINNVGDSSSPVAFENDSVGGSGGKARGTGRIRSTGRGGGSIGGGSPSREVSLTRDTSVGRALSPALAIVSQDTTTHTTANIRTSPAHSGSPAMSREPMKLTTSTTNTTNDGGEVVHKPKDSGWGGRRIKGVSMKNMTNTTKTVTTNDGGEVVHTPKHAGWGGRRIKGVSMKNMTNDIGVTGQQQRSPEL